MAQLSEWLRVMLAEIARKRDDAERAREEDARRLREARNGKSDEKQADPDAR